MSFAVRVTRRAASNLDEIAGWIAAEGGPAAALRWIAAIEEALSALSEFPARYPLAPEDKDVRGPEIRHAVLGNYRVLFLVRNQAVFVLHVRHASRRSASPGELTDAIGESRSPLD